jgi:ABC-type glycerol-3-phosphate transport system substrate-binding protein
MKLRLAPLAALLVLAACGTSTPTSAQEGSSGPANLPATRPPFTTAEVTTFDSPWAMDFLSGSGVPRTNTALVTEKAGPLCRV